MFLRARKHGRSENTSVVLYTFSVRSGNHSASIELRRRDRSLHQTEVLSMSTVGLGQVAYHKIREMFQESNVFPGMKITETTLAKQLGMSRTPVREAIRQLQMEGFVYQVPQRGTYVSKPGRREIAEVFEIRLALEVQAAAKAAVQLSHEQLEKLAELHEQMCAHSEKSVKDGNAILDGKELEMFLAADKEFHLLIFVAADNHMATKIFTDIQLKNRFFGDRSHHRDPPHMAHALEAHRKILRALQQRDAITASRCVADHINDSLQGAMFEFDNCKPASP